ncbi:Flp family type IVb pilin [Acetobacterium tundrae]|uniref:Flp family type IVb pilin n=1 Tax=Acetobacterium tundrae TaxID=132932 RepID=A0ABR6WJP5_9FIRM|nr:Flp family type IVb pilin [Acetobacterium tundrae]MBC3796498.1 Flp family type IVb pilin [Acetobacterium tundrae]
MKNMFAEMITDEDGQGMVEYGLIIAGVALAAIVAIYALGPVLNTFFVNIKTQLTTPAA